MRVSEQYNNLGLESLAIMFVLKEAGTLPISKILLVLPFTAHKAMLNHLAHGRTKVQSFERYLIERTSYFSNFNDRYYDNLVSSMNAVQLLSEIGAIEIVEGNISLLNLPEYSKSMGIRANKIFKASKNISTILAADVDILHLNLRVEL